MSITSRQTLQPDFVLLIAYGKQGPFLFPVASYQIGRTRAYDISYRSEVLTSK